LGNRSANTWDAMLSRLQGKPVEDSDILSEIFFSSLFLSIIPNRLRKVSRLTDVSVLDAAKGLLEHVKAFNQQKSSVA